MTTKLTGLRQIVNEFEAILIDQYGVLHNGQIPFEGAIESLRKLKRLSIPIVTITNSGRLKSANWKRM